MLCHHHVMTVWMLVVLLLVFDNNTFRNDSGFADKEDVAVVIGSLPVALASFSLAERYGVGQSEMAGSVVLGTLVMVPVALLWTK